MKIGITFSSFDLLHAGYILMLQEAKQHCDYLIVGLQTDPSISRPNNKSKPAQTIVERQIQLSAVKYVDEVVVYETEQDLLDILTIYPVNVRFIGEEYHNKEFTGKDYCLDNNIELIYTNRKHRFDAVELRQRAILKY